MAFILIGYHTYEAFLKEIANSNFSVINFGKVADEITGNTFAFQKTIDASSVSG